MAGTASLTGISQTVAETTTTGEWTDAIDLEDSGHADVCVDVSGAATLTVAFSTNGKFAGEEWTTTIEYSEATEMIEQFSPTHQYVRAQVDANLSELQVVKRGM